MKFASKLPKRNGLAESDLPGNLIRHPYSRRLLVVEVVTDKIERIFDDQEGTEVDVPTARIVAGEYIDDPRDISTVRLIADRAKGRRAGADTIPGLDSVASSILQNGRGILGGNFSFEHAGQTHNIEDEAE